MTSKSQKRAIQNYRERLDKRGLARFEVLAPDGDRELFRELASRLSKNDGKASEIRTSIKKTIAGKSSSKGGILAALRRSPMVGADLNLKRERTSGRKVSL